MATTATAMLVPTAASQQSRKTNLASSFVGKRYQHAGFGCAKCKSRIVCESEETQTDKDRWKGLTYDTSDDQQDITRGKGLVDSLFQGPQGAGTQTAVMSSLEYLNLSQRTYSMDNMKDGFYIAPAFMEKLVIHIAKNFLNIPSIKVPLILGVWGGKGQGKSFQCELVFAKMGINPIVMSAGELESGNAGEPAKLIRQRYREASDIIRTRNQMCVLFINDLDAGAGRMGGTTQYTVNNQMVNATLMNIADNPTNVQLPGIYKKEEIPRVPIIVTGNDFSTLYAPLIRDGRMEKFYWAPTREDRIGVCKGIFKADKVPDDDVVKLVDTFSGQSIDFFSALRARVYDDEVRKWIGQVGVENIGPKLLDSKDGPPVFQQPPMTINKLLEYGNMLVEEQENVKRVQLSGKYMREAALGDANEDEIKRDMFYGKAAQQVKVPVPEGCTDPEAGNFDPTARSDDGTCTYDFAEKDDKETKAKATKAEDTNKTKTEEAKLDLKPNQEVKPAKDKPKEELAETKAEAKPGKDNAAKTEAKQTASSDRSLPEKVLRAAVSILLLPFNQSCNGSDVYLSARKRKFIQGASFCTLAKLSGFLDSYQVSAAASNTLQPCPAITQQVFFDITIDGEPAGRIVVGLYGDEVPVGAKRFSEITAGKKGVSYRKRDFVKITPTYVKNSGIRTFSLGARAQDVADFTGGPTSDELVKEMRRLDEGGTRLKNVKTSVSIVVVDPTKPPAKPKLMSRAGKFELVYEESRPDPNGTEFCIAYQDAPELDATNLVVGRVVEGMEVVEKIASTRAVQDNTNNPYFRTAKLIGDTRAVVAERGFNRPYSKIVVSKCGLLV